jgi:2-C-methyl-D-erythritol 4-phosphate cytidylyltransferase
MKRRPKVFTIVVAAGSGTRFGSTVPKQFLALGDRPLVVQTLRRFENSSEVDETVVVVPESSVADMEALVSQHRLHKVKTVVAGGRRRQDSVASGLKVIRLQATDIVLVHDGVRPFVEPRLIAEVITQARRHKAAVPAVQPKDTVRRSGGGVFFDRTVDRTALWLVQTPQAFSAGTLKKAMALAVAEGILATDESALVERVGIKTKIVQGSYDNIKITTQEDLELGRLIYARWKAAESG